MFGFLSFQLSYMKAILLFLCQLSGCHGYNKLLQMQESAVRAAIGESTCSRWNGSDFSYDVLVADCCVTVM